MMSRKMRTKRRRKGGKEWQNNKEGEESEDEKIEDE